MLISTNAIILKTIPYGESSIIFRIFTEDYGKVSVMAKGVRKPKQPLGLFLEPMNHIYLQYYHKNTREIQILKDAGLIHQYSVLRSKLDTIIIGQSIVEALDKSTLENNSLPILYRLAWRVLDKINCADVNLWAVFAFYLYQLSLRLGFMPNLKTCYQCKSVFEHALINDKTGELMCYDCNPYGKLAVNKGGLIFLQKLENMHLDEINSEINNSSEIFNALSFLKIFTYIHIDGIDNMRSLEIMQKCLNNN